MYIYKRLQSFLEKENLPGLKTISEKIEENLNIYLKLFVLLYAAISDPFNETCISTRGRPLEKMKILFFSAFTFNFHFFTHNLSIECQLELFDKMVKPMLLYGSEIWGYSKNIDLRFCKLLLKLV
jgi:hypothetical protein